MANSLKSSQIFTLSGRQRKDRFLVLYHPTQKAFHIETESNFRNQPQNGYKIYGICNSRIESERTLKKLVHVLTSERRLEQ